MAVGLALAFSLNLPLALLAVWFNNPLTLPFMYLYAYRTGCLVLHQTPEPFHLSWTLHWLEQEAATLVPPFLLGSLLRFDRDRVMSEEAVRALIREHGFTIANLSYRLEEGDTFEYRMMLRTMRAKNLGALARTLGSQKVVEQFRLSPTGD